MLRIIEVSRISLWNGVGIPPTSDLLSANQQFKSSRLKIVIPIGTYALLGHDNEIALLQPLRNVHPHWAKWFWVTEIRNLIPQKPIYSKFLPIVVDGQKLDRPCIHHDAPSKEAKLWRYMDFEKFKSMLDQSGIFLSRADKFKDPLEGTLSPANKLYRAEIYHNDPVMKQALAHLTEELSKMKRWAYVSCWRLDEGESFSSWRRYVGISEGLAVQTTYRKIAQYTACIFCATVRYVNFKDTWIMEGNTLFPFMHKNEEQFGWENEFRIIVQKFPEKDVSFNQQDYYECEQENPFCGQVLRVDLRDLIEKIVITPFATTRFKNTVKQLAAKYELQDKVVESNFNVGLILKAIATIWQMIKKLLRKN